MKRSYRWWSAAGIRVVSQQLSAVSCKSLWWRWSAGANTWWSAGEARGGQLEKHVRWSPHSCGRQRAARPLCEKSGNCKLHVCAHARAPAQCGVGQTRHLAKSNKPGRARQMKRSNSVFNFIPYFPSFVVPSACAHHPMATTTGAITLATERLATAYVLLV